MVSQKKTFFYTALIYFFVVVGFVTLRICASLGLFSGLGEFGSIILGIITQIGLIFFIPFLLFKLFSKISVKETFKSFNYRKISWKMIVISICLGIVIFFLNLFASSFFNAIIQLLGYKPKTFAPGGYSLSWWGLILNLFVTAVLPAICEETLHRGMLMNGLSSLGLKRSILFSGLMFGLLHLNIEQFFYATLIGLFLGYLCKVSNSIYPCIIVHFMNNAISVLLSFASLHGWGIGNVFGYLADFFLANPILGFVLMILFVCLLLFVCFQLVYIMGKESFEFNVVRKQKEIATTLLRDTYFQQVESIKNDENAENTDLPKSFSFVVKIDQLFNFLTKHYEGDVQEKQIEKSKIEIATKVFLIGAILLSAIITILTFIWGLL